MGALMLSFMGLLTSIWADKFDHAAAVTNFVVTPLSLLSGTFYSVHQLSPSFQAISHANPFFYVISGFRVRLPRDLAIRRLWSAAIVLLAAQHRSVGALLRAVEKRLEDQAVGRVKQVERLITAAFSVPATAKAQNHRIKPLQGEP